MEGESAVQLNNLLWYSSSRFSLSLSLCSLLSLQLLDLMGGPAMSAPTVSTTPAFSTAPAAPAAPAPAGDSIVAFEKDGLQVTFSFSKPPGGEISGPGGGLHFGMSSFGGYARSRMHLLNCVVHPLLGNLMILVSTSNSTPMPLNNYVFQAAVPKVWSGYASLILSFPLPPFHTYPLIFLLIYPLFFPKRFYASYRPSNCSCSLNHPPLFRL